MWRRESPIGLIAPSSVVAWYGFNLKRILIGARLFMSGHQHMPTLASKGKSNPISKATHLCLSHSNSCLLLFCYSMAIINVAVAIMLSVTSFHLHVNSIIFTEKKEKTDSKYLSGSYRDTDSLTVRFYAHVIQTMLPMRLYNASQTVLYCLRIQQRACIPSRNQGARELLFFTKGQDEITRIGCKNKYTSNNGLHLKQYIEQESLLYTLNMLGL